MTDEERLRLRCQNTLANVFSYGEEFFVGWLKQAYCAHEEQREHLLAKLDRMRHLFLQERATLLTVEQAQLCNVCRICRGEYGKDGPPGPFLLNFGTEFAHATCLKAATTEKKVGGLPYTVMAYASSIPPMENREKP